MPNSPLIGSCLCGRVRYELDVEPFDCCFCHCSICRKLTGSFAGSYGSVPRSAFRWIEGSDFLSVFSPTGLTRRHFCSNCGSFLLTEHEAEPDNVFVSLGCLDSDIQSRPLYHQFVDSKPQWDVLGSSLPEHAEWPKS